MKLIDAAERVHSLATYGALENADQVLPEDAAGQREAIALFEDMIVNHWEEIEEHYAAGIEALERLVESPCVFHAHVAIDSMNMWPPVPR